MAKQIHRCPVCRAPFNSEFFLSLHFRNSPECAPPPVSEPVDVATVSLVQQVTGLYANDHLSMRSIAAKTGISRVRVKTILAKLGYASAVK